MNYLARRGLARALGTLIVVGSVVLVFALAVSILAPVVVGEVQRLVAELPTFISSAQSDLGLGSTVSLDPQQLLDSAREALSGDTLTTALGLGVGVASAFTFLLVVLTSTVFVVASPGPLVNGFVALFPAGRRERTREILTGMYDAVQKWFLGQLADMVLVGILYTVTLSIIGVPFAVLFGILGGLVCFVPFVGPVVSAIPPALVALFQDPILAVWVLLAYLAIQLLESNVIQPVIMSHAISLHPVVLLFAILTMGTLFQAIGVVLAVPLVAALHVLLRELWIKQMDEQGTDPNPPNKSKPSTAKGRLRRAAESLFRRSLARVRRERSS